MTRALVAFALCACSSSHPPRAAAPPSPAPRDAAAAAAPAPMFTPPPFELPAPKDAIAAVASDSRASCVVRASGHVDCWDLDGVMLRMPDIADAVAVAGDEQSRCVARPSEITCFELHDEKLGRPHHVALAGAVALVPGIWWCALAGGGRIACWSLPGDGKPTFVREVHDATSLVGNGSTTCATVRDGHMWCTDLSGGKPSRWRRIAGLDDVRVLAIRAGGDMPDDACAVRTLGVVTCFVIDVRTATAWAMRYEAPEPAALDAMRGATALAMDPAMGEIVALVGGHVVRVGVDGHAETLPVLADANAITVDCARRAQGSVVCWGDRATGQPRLWHADLPVPVVGIADVVSIATSADRSAAVTRDGRAFRWGWTGDRAVAVALAGSHDLASVVIEGRGNANPCFLRRTRRVTCISTQDEPVDMGLDHVVSLTSDGYYLALLPDGTVHWWTDPILGKTETLAPIPGAVEVLGDPGYYCGRDPAGRVWCVGRDVPRTRVAIAAASAIALVHGGASQDMACALVADAVSCWERGQEASPHAIALGGHTVELRGEGEHVCAKRVDLSLACWTFDDAPHAVLPAGSLDGPLVGGENGCTIRKDGRAACWGGNSEGRLGDGSILELDSPAAVPGLQ
jgi:hypothetical protein